MKTLPPQFEELADLVWALVNDRLDAAGATRLEQLLDGRGQPAGLSGTDGPVRLAGMGEGRGTRGVGDRGTGLGTSVPSEVVSGQWSVVSESEIRNQKSEIPQSRVPSPQPRTPHSAHHHRHFRHYPLLSPSLHFSAGRLAVLLRGRHGDHGHGDPGRLAVQGVP